MYTPVIKAGLMVSEQPREKREQSSESKKALNFADNNESLIWT